MIYKYFFKRSFLYIYEAFADKERVGPELTRI